MARDAKGRFVKAGRAARRGARKVAKGARSFLRRVRRRAKPRKMGLVGKAGAFIAGVVPVAGAAIDAGRGFFNVKDDQGNDLDIFTKMGVGLAMAVNNLAVGFGFADRNPLPVIPPITPLTNTKTTLPQPFIPKGSYFVTTSVGIGAIVIDRLTSFLSSVAGGPRGGTKLGGMQITGTSRR